jgi:hypothetical protein
MSSWQPQATISLAAVLSENFSANSHKSATVSKVALQSRVSTLGLAESHWLATQPERYQRSNQVTGVTTSSFEYLVVETALHILGPVGTKLGNAQLAL